MTSSRIPKAREAILSGSHSSVIGGDDGISRGKSTSPSRHGDLVPDGEVPNDLQIVKGEDKSDVSLDAGKEAFGRIERKTRRTMVCLTVATVSLLRTENAGLVYLVGFNVVNIDH